MRDVVSESVHNAKRDIIVNNASQKKRTDYLPLAITLAANVSDSVLIFNSKLKLIFFNNAFGTFDNASDKNVKNLKKITPYLNSTYKDADLMVEIIKKAKKSLIHGCVTLTRRDTGEEVRVSCSPVPEGIKLTGVVVVAKKV